MALGGLKGGGVVGFASDVGQLGGVGQVPLEDGVELTEEFFYVLELFLQFLRHGVGRAAVERGDRGAAGGEVDGGGFENPLAQ